MLENQFFPVTKEIVAEMVTPLLDKEISRSLNRRVLRTGNSILDPQAGKGDMFIHLRAFMKEDLDKYVDSNWESKRCFAAEVDPQLRLLLNEQEINVIASDWLAFDEPETYDTILSNPPFADADKHFLKSLEYLSPGGTLVQLFNAETLRNPYTKSRQRVLAAIALSWGIDPATYGILPNDAAPVDVRRLYQLLVQLEEKGAIKWMGKPFKQAERTTDVEVVCVWLSKPKELRKDFDWSTGDFQPETEEPESVEAEVTSLAAPGAIKALVARYKEADRLLQERATLSSGVNLVLRDVADHCRGLNASSAELTPRKEYVREHRILKNLFWQTVFDMTELGNKLGSKEQRRFREFACNQAKLQFTEHNIAELVNMLIGDIEGIMNRLIVDVFDRMTGFHEDNRKHSEGWKTNAPAKIKNRRVILPRGVTYDDFWGFRMFEETFIADLDKALCWVSGLSHETLKQQKSTTLQALSQHCDKCGWESGNDRSYADKFNSRFFEMRMYKKGTLHLLFHDENLAKDFAIAAAAGRRWVGESELY